MKNKLFASKKMVLRRTTNFLLAKILFWAEKQNFGWQKDGFGVKNKPFCGVKNKPFPRENQKDSPFWTLAA